MSTVKQRVCSEGKQPCIQNMQGLHWWWHATSDTGDARNMIHEVQFKYRIDHEFEGLSDTKTTLSGV